jgi:hypothetical protein
MFVAMRATVDQGAKCRSLNVKALVAVRIWYVEQELFGHFGGLWRSSTEGAVYVADIQHGNRSCDDGGNRARSTVHIDSPRFLRGEWVGDYWSKMKLEKKESIPNRVKYLINSFELKPIDASIRI